MHSLPGFIIFFHEVSFFLPTNQDITLTYAHISGSCYSIYPELSFAQFQFFYLIAYKNGTINTLQLYRRNKPRIPPNI